MNDSERKTRKFKAAEIKFLSSTQVYFHIAEKRNEHIKKKEILSIRRNEKLGGGAQTFGSDIK